jgi:syntaxin-binding protein 5
MVEQMKMDDQERRKALREGRAPPPVSGDQETYWSSMSRAVQERTERLGLASDTMDRLEENSSNFATDVGKYVQSQKRKAVFGGK